MSFHRFFIPVLSGQPALSGNPIIKVRWWCNLQTTMSFTICMASPCITESVNFPQRTKRQKKNQKLKNNTTKEFFTYCLIEQKSQRKLPFFKTKCIFHFHYLCRRNTLLICHNKSGCINTRKFCSHNNTDTLLFMFLTVRQWC